MIHRFSVVISEDLSHVRKEMGKKLHLLGVSLGPVGQWGVSPRKQAQQVCTCYCVALMTFVF